MKEINNNIQEPICSSEVSQLLKEKGFDVKTSQFYRNDESIDPKRFIGLFYKNSDFAVNTFIAAPTHSIALEWIRVNFGIHLRVSRIYRRPLFDEPAPEPMFTVEIDDLYSKNGKAYSDGVIDNFDTPQEAIEAALLYTLTNLIP